MGTPRTVATAFAVATPTRNPVNRPGPMSTATTPMSSSVRPRSQLVCAIAGVSSSAW